MSNCVKIIVGAMAKGKDIMLKIAVIDDEEYYSELIRQTVCNWLMEKGCQGEIDCFDHADDFKTQIENGRCYDIYFMDIEMPDISGMELASYVRMKYDSPFIVFVTAHMEYSVKCYRYHAWQYITKDSIRTLIPETMDSLIQHLQAHKSNYYMIEGANDLIRIAYDQIQYLSKDGKYTLFHTGKPEVFRERRALSKVIEDMQQVDDAFIMTDKSYGVNIRHVLRLKDHMLTMRNGDSVPISLPRYQQVKKGYQRLLGAAGMEIAGITLRVLEIITVILCGIRLAVPPGHFRWERLWTKVLYWILVIFWIVFAAGNIYFYKFSSIGELITGIGIFILLIIFYDTYFWQVFVQFFVYWYTVYVFRHLYVFTLCYLEHIHLKNYVTVADGLGWHWIHICGMAVTISVSLWLCYRMKGAPLVQRRYKKDYRYLTLFVLAEIMIGEYLFNNDVEGFFIQGEYILFSIIVFICLFSVLTAIIFYKGYKDMQYQQQISDMNFEMLKRQYEMIQKMYTEKRMLLHDSVHQDVLILEYLQDRKYEEAQTYFEKKIAATKKRSRNRYTGIEVLNLMLNYEIEQAEEKAINVDCAVEVYHCPVDETELCIIIGNLFDNAIEAVKDLPDEQRQIDFAIQNPNCIFRIEISNPYEGERRKIEHHYLTTKKQNTEMHGLGLMSVQKIVEKYDGLMEISDKDNVFRVVVTL